MVRAFSARNVRRAHSAWAAAWLAVVLNVFAPVVAYGAAAAAHRGAAAPAMAAMDHAGEHAHHHHHDSLPLPGAPVAPHCQYCLDFAAAAPLTLIVEVVVAVLRPESQPLPERLESGHPSAFVRLPWARGPPPLAT